MKGGGIGVSGLQASTEPADDKRGVYLLRAALPSAALREAPWSIFLSLYELLDEYPLHLIEVSLKCLLWRCCPL
jgi:hypothetical protein